MQLLFKRLSPTARVPDKGSARAAGYDLYADLGGIGETMTLFPGRRSLIQTNIAVACPENTYLRVAPRSGLSHKNGIMVLAGVIDEDYRGGIGVILYNSGDVPLPIAHNERIAQGIVEMLAPITEVLEATELPETTRGAGGFGSTGR